MTDRILTDILETEAEAAEIERRAGQGAKESVQEARLQAREMIETGVAEDERRYSEAVSDMETAAGTFLSKQLEASALTVEAVRAQAQERFGKAVSLIVEGIVGEYGHR